MNQLQARTLFDEYLDGELNDTDHKAMERVLANDSQLQSELDRYSHIVHLVQTLPAEPPSPRLLSRLRRKVRKRLRRRHAAHGHVSGIVAETSICVILIVILAGLYALGGSAPSVAPENSGNDSATFSSVETHADLTGEDRRLLSRFGDITVVGTSVTGNELEAHVTIQRSRLAELERALDTRPHLHPVKSSISYKGNRIWMKVRVERAKDAKTP